MRKYIAIIVLIAILTTLAACGQRIREGEVYDCEFIPAHTVVQLVPVTTFCGKTTVTTLIPYTYYYDDDYILCIRSVVDGELRTATYHVTREVYEACPIGSQFVYDPDTCDTEASYTREQGD